MEPISRDNGIWLAKHLGPIMGFLGKLSRRLETRGFTRDDELYRAVIDARDALHRAMTSI